MTTTRHFGVVALAFAALTAACGGGDSEGGPTFSDSVTTAEANSFAGGAASTASYLAENLNFGEPSIGAAAAMYARIQDRPAAVAAQGRMHYLQPISAAKLDWRALTRPEGLQASAAEGCTFSGHGMYEFPYGDPVDLNGNGIPDDVGIEVVCSQTQEAGGDTLVTYIYTQRVSIKEIAGSLWGMVVRYDISEGYSDNHGNSGKIQLKQNADLDIRSGSANTAQQMSLEYNETWDGESWEEGFGEEWSADFDPTGTITLGNPLPNGALTLGGRSYYFETEGRNLSFTISTPTPLAYSAACAAVPTNPPFTAGVLLGRLNNSSSQASFEVTFTGCGTYTVAVDNANDPAT